jgi:DNA repair exonuclease SbcCD ATPase subunit
MKATSAALLLSAHAVKVQQHPIGNVISMLEGLVEEVEAEGKTEALAFQKFEYWCKNSVKTLNKAIVEEKESIDSLESKIDAKTKAAAALEEQIAKLEKQIGKLEVRGKEAENARDRDNGLYEESHTDKASTIEAMKQCITIMEESKDATSLVSAQKQIKKILTLVETMSDTQRDQLQTFASTDPEDVQAKGDDAAHVKKYNFKSGNIIELLKELKMKFEDEQNADEKAETNSVNSYNLAKDARDNAISAATDSKDEKTTLLGETNEALSAAEADLSDTKDELESDSNTLGSTDKQCSIKNSEWEERTEIRNGELAAMNAAIKILAKVGGVSTEAPSNPIPPSSPMLLQSTSPDAKMKAVEFLRQQSKVLHAKALDKLAQEITAHLNGPFEDVTGMIQKMIFRLMAEQKDEDEHKWWCDQELNKTQASLDNKQDKMDELTAKMDDYKATVAELTEEIKAANIMISEITSFMGEANEIREAGKKENAVALKDAEEAMTAIANAISVLSDFYKESGQIPKEPYEFIQKGVDLGDKPETWEAGYTGASDPKSQPGGIISVLETTSEDFSEMAADTKAQEASDQKTFEDDMQEHDIEKAKRNKESEMKENEKKRLVEKLDAMFKTHKHVSDEHEATEQYQKDLQPACVEGDSTYEDRKEARTNEIEALHRAQDVLADAFKNAPTEEAEFVQKNLRTPKAIKRH